MSGGILRELLRRRVPQIVGVYLAAGWALLEFTDWAIEHFGLREGVENVIVTAAALLLPVVAAGAWRYGAPRRRGAEARSSTRDRQERGEPSPQSVAVLPFANLSGSPDMEYLSDGITEEIIGALARLENLRVASRTSTFVFKEKTANVRMIGEQLNVGSILEGSVQKSGDRLRITTQLVNAASGYHLWTERFDRNMEDVFAIQDEIAEQVARALRAILPEEEKRRRERIPTSDTTAYEFYLRGRQYFHQNRKKSLEYARQMFRRAIDIDGEYALAWAGVAECGSLLTLLYPGSPSVDTDRQEAEQASRKALELDPDLAEAHTARGMTVLVLGDLDEAEREFERAIELDPRQAEARYFWARACFQQGRMEEAARLFSEAADVGEGYQAAFFAAQSLETLGRSVEAKLQYRRALRAAAKHMELNPDDPRAATMRAVAHCRIGDLEAGMQWAERALEIDPEDAGIRYNVACLYALEGEHEKAISCLEQALDAGFGQRDWIEHDPDLASLRDDPRFQALFERL